MFFDAKATVEEVDQEKVVLEVTCLKATKTVTEPLVDRNRMMGWGHSFKIGEQLLVDIYIDDSEIEDEDTHISDLLRAKWRVCTIKATEQNVTKHHDYVHA